MKKNKTHREDEEDISEEIVFKTYHDNNLIHFEVTLAKDDEFFENKYFALISGLPELGEIKDINTLKRIIKCLKAAEKRWEEKTRLQSVHD